MYTITLTPILEGWIARVEYMTTGDGQAHPVCVTSPSDLQTTMYRLECAILANDNRTTHP